MKIDFLCRPFEVKKRTRNRVSDETRRISRQLGRDYFDGDREYGYGGYYYDGRWQAVADRLIKHYRLGKGDRVTDIGCAKGFLVKDLLDRGIDAWGIDASEYAIAQAPEEVRARVVQTEFPDGPFLWHRENKLCVAINMLHYLDRRELIRALKEMTRISERQFVQVDCYENEQEEYDFDKWNLCAVTHGTPLFWLELFEEAGYKGDYWWTKA